MKQPKTLVINPGSTTTKLALYKGLEELFVKNICHEQKDLQQFSSIIEQKEYRLTCIHEFIHESGITLTDLDIVMGRGGLLHPLEGGIYRISQDMLTDLEEARYGEHASNLGAPLAQQIAKEASCEAYIADPVVVDELIPEARVTGMPELERKSIFHALNQKIAAREVAEMLGKPYEETRLIVAHLGGGISIGAHRDGRVIDVNNALDGDGPFTPERSGGLPAGDLMRLAFSGTYTASELQRKICGAGGMSAYMGTSDVRKILKRAVDGEEQALFYIQTMIYQISKDIGALATVLHGNIDAIVLTGGMAHANTIVDGIRKRVGYLAKLYVIPGEREMLSLAENAFAVYNELREVKDYECI